MNLSDQLLPHGRPPHVASPSPAVAIKSAAQLAPLVPPRERDLGRDPLGRDLSVSRGENVPHSTPPFDFDTAYAAAYHRFTGMARKLTPDPDAVNDLIQDASLLMFRKQAQFTPGTDFGAWGCTIVRNLYYDEFRRRQRRARIVELNPGGVAWSQDRPVPAAAERKLAAEDLDGLLDALSLSQRRAFTLYRDGYQITEIAEACAEPVGTIKSRLFYARKALARAYERRYA